MTSTATHYIAERLTTVDWLLTIWPVLRRRCAGRAPDGCAFYYVDATPRAARLAAWMCERIGIRAARLEFDAAQTFDPQGLLVWLRTYYRDLADALSHIERESGFPDAPAPGDPSRYLSTYVRKQCVPGRTLVAGSGVWRSVYLTHVCLEHARRGAPPQALVMWCENQPWFAGVASYAASLGPISLRPLGRAYRPAPFVPAVLARDLKVIGERLLRRGKREGAASQIAPAPITNSTIAIQYYGQFNLDAPALHSDFFFWQRSKLEGRRIVGLFGFPQDPLDARRMRELREHGMHALALRASATTLPHALFAKTSLVRNLGRAVSICAGIFAAPRAAWTRANVHVFEAETRYWMRLFEQTRSRVFLTWFKYTSDHAPIGEAMRRSGGVLAVYQRSFEGNSSAQTAFTADLAFGFSRLSAAVEARSGSVIDYYVITGYLGDHRAALARPAAKHMREALREHGAEFVVAYFDEGTFPDPRWGVGAQRTQSNYAFLLERVLAEPGLGLVLKPKTPRTLRARLGPVVPLLDRALATGRCSIMEEGVLQGSVPPVQAALAADVAIHESVASGTAAMEAALAGVPTLLIDHDGWTISPLYRLGVGSVIFNDWEHLWTALAAARRNAKPEGFGDWAPVIDELDPYRDGRAAERMGTFLEWLMESFDRGDDRDRALAGAAQRYADAWGADKIIRAAPASHLSYPAAA